MKKRARDLGIPFEGEPGKYNAITDVAGVTVGYSTIIEGSDARTGVTIIHPRGMNDTTPAFAGLHSFNGNGEMTGAAWVEEGGLLEGPIGLTNTHSVGVVHNALIKWLVEYHKLNKHWLLPVVAETADAWLNDMNGFFVQEHHVMDAINSAGSGAIAEGNVGGGTGMLCYEFKGGTGTSSRKLPEKFGGWTVGALAQCNFGRRYQLTIAGAPVGSHMKNNAHVTSGENPFRQEAGSLIVIIATDAPLLPHQLKRVAKRVTLGMGRTGALGGNGSGDIFLAFSTANPDAAKAESLAQLEALPNGQLDPIFAATAYATEEAIINALIAAEDMQGHEISAKAIPHEELVEVLRGYGRVKASNE